MLPLRHVGWHGARCLTGPGDLGIGWLGADVLKAAGRFPWLGCVS